MANPTFHHLNPDWNAEPHAPFPSVEVIGASVRLRFVLDAWAYAAVENELGFLTFSACSRWRLGPVNDEAWHNGECRYSKLAPEWGEFYEISGEDELLRTQPDDWRHLSDRTPDERHFLFYLHDDTFECLAKSWTFERRQPKAP
jgi:hypothetical protein